MKALLSAHRMQAEAIGKWEDESSPGAGSDQPPTKRPVLYQYFLHGALCWPSRPDVRIPVKVLLDTGCDITLVSADTVRNLETALQERTGEMLPLYRTLLTSGVVCPAYDLAFLLPETGHPVTSGYGFVSVTSPWWGSTVDMLLGQDLINQWIITYDGIHGTLTIAVP